MDFNKKDHIVVTIAQTGEKRHILISRVRAVAPAQDGVETGPSRLEYDSDIDGAEPITIEIAEPVAAVVRDLNGDPTDEDIARMTSEIIRERQETCDRIIENLKKKFAEPDKEIAWREASNAKIDKDLAPREEQVEKFERGTARSAWARFIEKRYLNEAYDKKEREPHKYHLMPDGWLLRLIGGQTLHEIKTAHDNKYHIDEDRLRQNKYVGEIEKLQKERETEFQSQKERYLNLRNDPQLSGSDRARLEKAIRDHRVAHGPAQEFCFVRDSKTKAYRPERDIKHDQEQELTREQRGQGRGRDRDRGGPDYSR